MIHDFWVMDLICIFAERNQLKNIDYATKWLDLHRDELMENWMRAQNGGTLEKIEPLK